MTKRKCIFRGATNNYKHDEKQEKKEKNYSTPRGGFAIRWFEQEEGMKKYSRKTLLLCFRNF